jgi:hypothetical protein
MLNLRQQQRFETTPESEVNVNENYKFVWIAPERVGSRSTCKILTYCGFMCRGQQLSSSSVYNYTHHSQIPTKYKDYQIISSARNPYSRTLSIYKTFITIFKKGMTFEEWILSLALGNPEKNFLRYPTFTNPVLEKQPEYVIRLENIYEDFKKIPFIFNHLTEKQLEMMCEHGKEIDEWESYYTQEMKDLVYKHLKHQFDMWGYEK